MECNNEIGKNKSKTGKISNDSDAGEKILGFSSTLKGSVKEESERVAQTSEDEVVNAQTLNKNEVICTNECKKGLEKDEQINAGKSLKRCAKTQIHISQESESDDEMQEKLDASEAASGDFVMKTVSNVERVKRKLEEIMEASKVEEDAVIEELHKMKREKTEILNKISSEMEKLKTILTRGKVENEEK